MKRSILIFIFIAIIYSAGAAEFIVSGINELEYVYKTSEDSLHHFLKDEFGMNLYYGNFNFGLKFIAELPKYDTFKKIEKLNNSDISYEWKERYISYDDDNFYVLGGTFEDTFGRGIVFSAFEDEDFDIDTRLEGVQAQLYKKFLSLKGLYGAFKTDIVGKEDKSDLAYGLDLDINPFKSLKIGVSTIGLRYIHNIDNEYTDYRIYGGKLNYLNDLLDIYLEAAQLKEDEDKVEIGDAKDGKAIYANFIAYPGKFTFSASYKKYDDFNHRMNDLPTVNHSGEPLTENSNFPIGFDEEGVMAEIRYVPNYENEYIINYAEGWNSDKDIKQADFYGEARHDFDKISVTAEYSHLEILDELAENWEKKLKPSLAFDLMLFENPVFFKVEYEIIDQEHGEESNTYYEPLLQFDMNLDLLGFSILAESRYDKEEGLSKAKVFLGAEIISDISESTQIKLFGGKQKGGKICRNGTCRYQSSFEGLRMELITMF